MAVFKYLAKSQDGKEVSGAVEAGTENAAVSLLKSKGLYVISVTKKDKSSILERFRDIRGVSNKEKVNFTRQLATMVAAGLPLPKSLEVLAEQTTNASMKRVIVEALRDVEGGSPLSVSVGKFPNVFSPTYKALIRAGEASGKMQEILLKLADTMEAQQEFRGKFETVYGPGNYSDLPKLYVKYINAGYFVYSARYGLGNEGYLNESFTELREKFKLTLVKEGCYTQCNIYKVELR